MNLYEIDDAILECVDTETGDIIDVERLEALELERDTKISNIACWIKDLNAEAEAIKAEKQALDKRQKVSENKAESLKRYLQGYLGGAKYKDGRCAISYRNSESVEFDENLDVSTLPSDLVKVKVEPSKTLIKQAIKDGRTVEGCHIVSKENIQIR